MQGHFRDTTDTEYRTTLAETVFFQGKGIHSGRLTKVAVHPAYNGGILFVREGHAIPADWRNVTDTRLSTTLSRNGVRISTVEHLMSSLFALGITDALVEAENEIPILDGSALPFALGLHGAGIAATGPTRRHIRVLKPVGIEHEGRTATLLPSKNNRLSLDVTIDFANRAIGKQRWSGIADPETFIQEIAPARTFGFVAEMSALNAQGLALGATADACIGITHDGTIVNPEGLRFPDEAVRHKVLDAIGDLALAGAPLCASYVAIKPGHAMNIALLEALFADRTAWRYEDLVIPEQIAA